MLGFLTAIFTFHITIKWVENNLMFAVEEKLQKKMHLHIIFVDVQ